MISFRVENVSMPRIDRGLIRKWIKAVASAYGLKENGIGYIFCDDERILEVNRQFLGHDYYTDIITFDYSEPGNVSGELYISLDTVMSNSVKFRTQYERELLRVIIHGVLHLCGIQDKGPGQRAVMEAAEDRALAMFDEMTEK